ncbi:transposase [Streptomyces sp. NPDC048415]|uniref:transposase n=1 Tax=Streptomyces sp. NPDC048415 TaxID=3154822 RepID=UPI00341ADA7D
MYESLIRIARRRHTRDRTGPFPGWAEEGQRQRADEHGTPPVHTGHCNPNGSTRSRNRTARWIAAYRSTVDSVVPVPRYHAERFDVDGQADVIRLVTSLTDHEECPAAELATLYARRWEIEIVFDEIKTHQRGRPVLRSQTPDGVRQEIYAHLIVHHATRDLLNDVARIAQTSAERTSFTRALHVVRRSVITPSGFSPPRPESMTAFSASPRFAGPSCPDDAHATAPAN